MPGSCQAAEHRGLAISAWKMKGPGLRCLTLGGVIFKDGKLIPGQMAPTTICASNQTQGLSNEVHLFHLFS
jgi:hypothetical protein